MTSAPIDDGEMTIQPLDYRGYVICPISLPLVRTDTSVKQIEGDNFVKHIVHLNFRNVNA